MSKKLLGVENRCAAPKDPRPMVTTYFCVYEDGHEGSHSWQDPPEVRAQKLRPKDSDAD